MFKIILGWIQQHVVATIIISAVFIGGAVATPVILLNSKDIPKEEKQPVMSQSIVLREELNFEINSELSLLSLVSEDNNVKIVSDDELVDTSTLGEKELVIKYLDNNQEKEQYFKISIVDTTNPIIDFKNELSTTVGVKIDLLKDVKVNDNSKEDIKATIEGEYNFNKEGTYNLKYVAIDSSGNKAEEEFTLKVNKKQTNSSNNNSSNTNSTNTSTNNNSSNTNVNSNNSGNTEKPVDNTPTKPADPLKKYCDNHIAGYSNESGVCVNLYPDELCGHGKICFGVSFGSPEDYPDGEEEYYKYVEAQKAAFREAAKAMCAENGYGWTDVFDGVFGDCTW